MKSLLTTLLLSLVVLGGHARTDTNPNENSNETAWAEFIANDILNVLPEAVEYTLPDGRRIDIYDKDNNISYEVDWCQKWEEGIGQSLGYAIATNSQPGIQVQVYRGKCKIWKSLAILVKFSLDIDDK